MPGDTTGLNPCLFSKYNSVPMKSSSNSDSISSLICKVVLSSSASSGHELHLFTSKQSHCLSFFYPLLFHARAVKEMYSNSLGLWSFPPKPGCSVRSVLTFVIFACMKAHNRGWLFSQSAYLIFFFYQKGLHELLWYASQYAHTHPSFLLWCSSRQMMTSAHFFLLSSPE